MPFRIVRNDITKVHTDAIVNTANPFPTIGKGTDTSVYNAAGREELLRARQKIGVIEPGHSVATKSFALRKNGIKYIIHTVGNHYDSNKPETVQNLRNCYSSSLEIAQKLKCKSIAIPLLATGYYGFPKELGLKIAVEEISSFLLNNDIDITLVVYDPKSYMISEKLFDDIQDFLDENYEGEEKQFALFSIPIQASAAQVTFYEAQENSSRVYDYEKIKKLVKKQQEKYGWEFIFLGANIDAITEAGRLGIASNRAVRYECDGVGTMLNFECMSESIANFRVADSMPENWKEKIEKYHGKKNKQEKA